MTQPAQPQQKSDQGVGDVLAELERLYDAGDKEALLGAVQTLLTAALSDVEQLSARVKELLRQLYGRKRDSVNPMQLVMALLGQMDANDAEPSADTDADAEPSNEAAPRRRRSGKRGRKALPAHLPREEIRITPTDEQLADISGEMKPFSETRSEVLEYVPAQFKVLVYIRETWSNDKGDIVTAPAPNKVIEKGLPGPGLLTQVVVAKFRDHAPLNRQVAIYRRSGIELSRNTLVDWVAAAARLVEPLARRIYERALAAHVLQVDDTSLNILDRSKAKNVKRGHIWAMVGDHDFVAYRYSDTWQAHHAVELLGQRTGWMQVDGYKGYERVFAREKAIEVGCWMHARRYFVRAFDAKDLRAAHPLKLISDIYDIEANAKQLGESHQARQDRRQRETAPLVESLSTWIAERRSREPPKSPLGKALTYAANHWTALCRPLEDGALELDNGDVERALRGIAIGRKNWLFAGSDRGAQRTANLCTVIETAARHKLDVWAYFRDIVVKLTDDWPQSRLDELLPDRWRDLHAPPQRAPDT